MYILSLSIVCCTMNSPLYAVGLTIINGMPTTTGEKNEATNHQVDFFNTKPVGQRVYCTIPPTGPHGHPRMYKIMAFSNPRVAFVYHHDYRTNEYTQRPVYALAYSAADVNNALAWYGSLL
jgi:hypothetical protein